MLQTIQSLDINILYWIQENLRFDFLNLPMIFFSKIGDNGMIWLIIIAVMLIWKKYRMEGLTALISILFSLLICNLLLKNLVHRIRPYDMYDFITILLERQTDYSFPSGHTSSSFAVSYVLVRIHGRKAWPYVVLAVFITFSRLYVGVHYPSDILAGIVTGLVSGLLALTVMKNLNTAMNK